MKNQMNFIARLAAASILAAVASGAAFAADDEASATSTQRIARGASAANQPAPDVIQLQHIARGGPVVVPTEDVVQDAPSGDPDPAVITPAPPVRAPRGG